MSAWAKRNPRPPAAPGIADETIADVIRRADELPQQRQIEALADDGGGLKGLPVERRQPVHAREHQALDGSGNGFLASFLGVAQQLFEKQRIAAGAFDAGKCQALRRVDEAPGEAQRLFAPQRTEIDGREGRARQLARHAASIGSPSTRDVITSKPGPSAMADAIAARWPRTSGSAQCRSSTMIMVGPAAGICRQARR